MELSLFGLLILSGLCASATIPHPEKQQENVIWVPVRDNDSQRATNAFNEAGEGGAYHFGFSHRGQVRLEHRDADGNVNGYYSYLRHTGQPTVVFYHADESGFKVQSNALPIAGIEDAGRVPESTNLDPKIGSQRLANLYDEAFAESVI